MNEQDYMRFRPIIEGEARRIAEDTSWTKIDPEDVEQEIWLHLIEKWKYYEGKDDALIRTAARKVGKTLVADERYRYIHNSAQYVYRPEDVRALFEGAFFVLSEWERMPVKEDATSADIVNGGIVVALWDLKAAFLLLNPKEKDVIVRRFFHGDTLEAGAERMRLSRAIDTVTRHLNENTAASQAASQRYNNGPGARKVISNAHANAITEF